jgi:hypothetical protein
MRHRATLALTATALLAAPATLAAPRPTSRLAAPRPTRAALAAPSRRDARILSADARLRAGQARTILAVPRVGRWTAQCAAHDDVGVAFAADRLLATSDLVVSLTAGPPLGRRLDPGDVVAPDPAGPVLSQRWQIAPFAAAQVHVTAATVAARRVSATECAASVVAVIGPDQGATRTG